MNKAFCKDYLYFKLKYSFSENLNCCIFHQNEYLGKNFWLFVILLFNLQDIILEISINVNTTQALYIFEHFE